MKKITSILALMLVQNSYALELQGVNGVDILAINGQEVESGFFVKSSANELSPGTHQIVVRYSVNFNNDELITSRPSIFTIDLQQDTKISAFDVNTKYKAERAVRKGVTWEVITADNKYNIENSDILRGEGFMPYSDIAGLVEAYNKEHNIIIAQPVEEKAAVVAATVTPTVVGASTVAATATVAPAAVQDLATLYQQSTPAQKKAFRLWLVEQDMK